MPDHPAETETKSLADSCTTMVVHQHRPLFLFNPPPWVPHCKSQNGISRLLKKSPACGWKVCAFKNTCRPVRSTATSTTAGLDVRRLWSEWQPHAGDLTSRWKCKVRQVSIALWWEISNSFWGFTLPFMSPPHPPSSASLSVLRWTFHPRPVSPCMCFELLTLFSWKAES